MFLVSSFLNEEDEDVGDDDDDEDDADDDDGTETAVPKKPKIIVSRSHTGTAKAIIEKNLPESELVIAAGSGNLKFSRQEPVLHHISSFFGDL